MFASIDNQVDKDWRVDIIDLKDLSAKASRTVKFKALNYVLVETELFKRSHAGLLLKCLRKKDVEKAMAEVHEGLCGAHQVRPKRR
jgi:hypothetical protein